MSIKLAGNFSFLKHWLSTLVRYINYKSYMEIRFLIWFAIINTNQIDFSSASLLGLEFSFWSFSRAILNDQEWNLIDL